MAKEMAGFCNREAERLNRHRKGYKKVTKNKRKYKNTIDRRNKKRYYNSINIDGRVTQRRNLGQNQ